MVKLPRSAQTLILPFILAGCSKSSAEPSAAPSAATSAPTAPRMLDVRATAAGKLGTLANDTGIPVGQKIPDVHARDLDGKDVSLSSLVERGPLLLVFYRGGWCPYCNSEIHALSEAAPDFEKRGVKLAAISVDKPDAEAKLKAQYQIPFPVLSDTEAKVIQAFKVVNQITEDQYSHYRSNGVDLEQHSGQKHHLIAIPSFFLIDRSKTVRFAHSDREFQVRPSIAQLLRAVDAALGNSETK